MSHRDFIRNNAVVYTDIGAFNTAVTTSSLKTPQPLKTKMMQQSRAEKNNNEYQTGASMQFCDEQREKMIERRKSLRPREMTKSGVTRIIGNQEDSLTLSAIAAAGTG